LSYKYNYNPHFTKAFISISVVDGVAWRSD
jgi:hypothetical protein